MLPVRWRPEAVQDLEDILDYLEVHNPQFAARLGAAIERTVERLPHHPSMYRAGRVDGTREAVFHEHYMLIYRVGEAIEILAVLDARRQYP